MRSLSSTVLFSSESWKECVREKCFKERIVNTVKATDTKGVDIMLRNQRTFTTHSEQIQYIFFKLQKSVQQQVMVIKFLQLYLIHVNLTGFSLKVTSLGCFQRGFYF